MNLGIVNQLEAIDGQLEVSVLRQGKWSAAIVLPAFFALESGVQNWLPMQADYYLFLRAAPSSYYS